MNPIAHKGKLDMGKCLMSCHFASLLDYVEDVKPEGTTNYDNWKWRQNKSHPGGRFRDWFGPSATNSKQVLNLALLGDDALGEMVREMWSELDDATGKRQTDYRQRIQQVKRRKLRSDFGDELDIHKVYQGHLDTAWTRTERIEIDVEHSLITLFIDIGGNCNIKCTDTLWRAAVATRLVSELEAAGKSVKVVVGGAVSGLFRRKRHINTTVSVVVKEFNQPLSVERLAAMTHIGFFRSFGFVALERFDVDDTTSHLGHSIPISDSIPVQLQEEIDEGHTRFVHIEGANSLHAAKRELESAYKQMERYAQEAPNG